jgi:hypothetical protein
LVEQVPEADVVAVARVLSVSERHPDGKRDWNNAAAHLEIVETSKGTAPERLEVPFPAELLCPAPPRYVEGQTVLAFLRHDADRWATVGLSYGTLYPDADDLPVMREAASEILALRPGDTRAHTALLVHLASRRATRWDGLFELVPQGDRLHDY